MIIGIPKERKTLEKRVALTPDGAFELVQAGHTVLIEQDAGLGSFFENELYKKAGAEIVATLAEVWQRSELIVKVKEPHESEYQYFRPGLAIFDYLHLAGLPAVADALLEKQVTGIAYELVQTHERKLPLLEPMSEVAGKLSVLNGAYFLLAQHGGRGVLLGGAVGVPPAEVVILGAGIAGRAACTVALGMGAQVSVLDIQHDPLDKIRSEFHGAVRTIYSTKASLARACEDADLLISAVLIPGARAPKLITREMIKSMPRGSVFVDISIDQGGSSETTRVTSLETPTYVEEGVIHYAVPNMPAQTARTSTMALTSVTLPYIKRLANHGVLPALKKYPDLAQALCTYQGKFTNAAVHAELGKSYLDLGDVLK